MALERRLGAVIVLAALMAGAAACGLGGGTLGGRETCWPAHEQRAASLWRGIFVMDATGGRLDTPEGDVIPLLPGELSIEILDGSGVLVHGGEVVAQAGHDVTLFGGAGADGNLVVCAVESNRGGG